MREDLITELVEVLHLHDDTETRLINLCRARGCFMSNLSKEEKRDHEKYEYLSMDLRIKATEEEYDEAIRRYDPD